MMVTNVFLASQTIHLVSCTDWHIKSNTVDDASHFHRHPTARIGEPHTKGLVDMADKI